MAVTAGRDHGHARRENARPERFATRYGRLEREVGVIALAHQAHRGDAGLERRTRVARHAQRQRCLGFADHPVAFDARQDQAKMHVHIDQASHDECAVQIDLVGRPA